MSRKLSLFAAVAVVACLSAAAMADLDCSNAWVDATNYTWAGTTQMTYINTSADIDWCVEYVGGRFKYKYQVQGLGSAPVTQLVVMMLNSNEAEDIGAAQIDSLDANEIAPNSMYWGSGDPNAENLVSANWSFDGIDAGEYSQELNYFSVNAPIFNGGYIIDGGSPAGAYNIPSPSDVIPEPATMGLLGLGAVALLRRRR